MNADYSEVPQRLCAYRKALEKTQKEMAEKFGVKQDHYSRLESGKTYIKLQSMVSVIILNLKFLKLILKKEIVW